jgi:hypothetical protein
LCFNDSVIRATSRSTQTFRRLAQPLRQAVVRLFPFWPAALFHFRRPIVSFLPPIHFGCAAQLQVLPRCVLMITDDSSDIQINSKFRQPGDNPPSSGRSPVPVLAGAPFVGQASSRSSPQPTDRQDAGPTSFSRS